MYCLSGFALCLSTGNTYRGCVYIYFLELTHFAKWFNKHTLCRLHKYFQFVKMFGMSKLDLNYTGTRSLIRRPFKIYMLCSTPTYCKVSWSAASSLGNTGTFLKLRDVSCFVYGCKNNFYVLLLKANIVCIYSLYLYKKLVCGKIFITLQ